MAIDCIIAATDFSSASQPALQRAARIASRHRAALQMVTVVPQGWLGEVRAWLSGADVRAGVDAVRARLQESAAALASHDISIDTEVLEGDPRTALAAHAVRANARLLVVGAHGRSLVGATVLGSTALALLERCDVPILVVRNEDVADYRMILAGIDFDLAARNALECAADLFPEAGLSLLHAYEEPFAAELFLGQADEATESHYRKRARLTAQRSLNELVEALGPLAARCAKHLSHGPPGLRLAQAAEQQRADLVVLGSRRKGALDAALLGSVAANVAMMVRTDVLLVRERRQVG